MRHRRPRSGSRAGFTLVELMVSFALIIFIMSVLAQAFHAAGRVVSDLKVATSMEEKLRGVMTMLRRDLAANHFDESIAGSQIKMSDSNFWSRLNFGNTPRGFFRGYQFGGPTPLGGGDGLPTYSMTQSALHFSVYRPADYPGNMFSAQVTGSPDLLTVGTPGERERRFQPLSGSVFRSPWGEIAYWMTPTGGTTAGGAGDPPLYFLRRRQRAIWPLIGVVANVAGPDQAEVSTPSGMPQANDPVRITVPAFRWNAIPGLAGQPATPSPAYPAGTTQDIVLADVLSFDVQYLVAGQGEFYDLSSPAIQAYSGANPAFGGGTGAYCFDTWTNQSIGALNYSTWGAKGGPASAPLFQSAAGNAISIRAVQVTLRIWDAKSQTARQMTMIQDM